MTSFIVCESTSIFKDLKMNFPKKENTSFEGKKKISMFLYCIKIKILIDLTFAFYAWEVAKL